MLAQRGVEIALLDWGGDGPLVLMHHANGFCAGTLGLVAEALVPAFRVIGMDARGHGDSSKPEGPEAYGWDHFALDYLAVAERLAAEHAGGRVGVGRRTLVRRHLGARRRGAPAGSLRAARARRSRDPAAGRAGRVRSIPSAASASRDSSKARASGARRGRAAPRRASTSPRSRCSATGCPKRSTSTSTTACACAPTDRSSSSARARWRRRSSDRARPWTSPISRAARARSRRPCCGRSDGDFSRAVYERVFGPMPNVAHPRRRVRAPGPDGTSRSRSGRDSRRRRG